MRKLDLKGLLSFKVNVTVRAYDQDVTLLKLFFFFFFFFGGGGGATSRTLSSFDGRSS